MREKLLPDVIEAPLQGSRSPRITVQRLEPQISNPVELYLLRPEGGRRNLLRKRSLCLWRGLPACLPARSRAREQDSLLRKGPGPEALCRVWPPCWGRGVPGRKGAGRIRSSSRLAEEERQICKERKVQPLHGLGVEGFLGHGVVLSSSGKTNTLFYSPASGKMSHGPQRSIRPRHTVSPGFCSLREAGRDHNDSDSDGKPFSRWSSNPKFKVMASHLRSRVLPTTGHDLATALIIPGSQ